MKNEYVICEAPLEYLDTDVVMECAICQKKEYSKIRCKNGHYVCNDCHMRGLNNIIGLCMKQTSDDPLEILDVMMAQPFSHMQGPEHHVMVGAALLTAYKNAGGEIDLRPALVEMMKRGKADPGRGMRILGTLRRRDQCNDVCIDFVVENTPLSEEPWDFLQIFNAKIMDEIGALRRSEVLQERILFISILNRY